MYICQASLLAIVVTFVWAAPSPVEAKFVAGGPPNETIEHLKSTDFDLYNPIADIIDYADFFESVPMTELDDFFDDDSQDKTVEIDKNELSSYEMQTRFFWSLCSLGLFLVILLLLTRLRKELRIAFSLKPSRRLRKIQSSFASFLADPFNLAPSFKKMYTAAPLAVIDEFETENGEIIIEEDLNLIV